MWKSLFLFTLLSICVYTYAQERAFSSAPVYSLTFDSPSTTPAGVEWQAGRGSNTGLAYFNGIDQFIYLNTTNDVNNRPFPSMDSSFTIEAWMSYENFQRFSHWVSLGNGPYQDNIYIGNTNTGNTVRYGTVYNPFRNTTNYVERFLERNQVYSVGVFSHIVATCNLVSNSDTTSATAAMLNLYVNGAFITNISQYNTQLVTRTQQYLGKSLWTADALFNGWIDSFHVYNYPLSDQAVFAHRYLQRVPVFELAFSEDPRQIAGSSATYNFVLADPADVIANVSQWHQGVVTLASASSQYMDLTVNSGSSTSGTTLPVFGGAGFGTGSNGFAQGWSFEFAFKTPQVNSGAKIFDSTAASGDRVYLGFSSSSLVFSVQFGTATASVSTVIATVSVNTWYHVIVVVVPVNIALGTAEHRIFVNGVSTSNVTTASYPASATRTTSYIGRSTVSTDSYADLVFDLVRIYDYALPAATVRTLYYSVSQPAPENPTPAPAMYSSAPSNIYGFDAQTSNTGYSQYTYINATEDLHFGVAAFNGVNSSVNFQYYPDANGKVFPDYIGGGSISFSIWAKWVDIPSWSRIFDFAGRLAEYDNNIILANQGTSTTLTFQVYSGSTASSVTVDRGVEPGRWQHIVAVCEQVSTNLTSPLSAVLRLYIDGVLRANTTGFVPPRVRRSNLLVGRSNFNADARFRGYMDSIAFYEYALNGQQVAAHASTSRPPVFEFAFTRDPRLIDPSITYNYGWIDTMAETIPANTPYINPTNSPVVFIHEGMISLNGANQYLNLTATSGPQSIGSTLPVIGGPGSGVGDTIGWSFEITFKLNSYATWAKLMDFGINANGDDDIIFGFVDNSHLMAFEILNNGSSFSQRTTVIPNAVLDTWYHVVVVITPVDLSTNTARATPFLNGEVSDTFSIKWPRSIPRKNANVGKSNWQDAYFNGTIDSLRIYDYAVSQDSVRSLYRATRSTPKSVENAPLYHPTTMNNFAFSRGYDPAESAVANFQWMQSYFGHDGVAYFNSVSNQYVNLLGYTDSNRRNFPIRIGGTDLSFTGWIRYESLRAYSRIFDISNGQGTHTIAFMNVGTTAQLALHVYNSGGNTAFNTNYSWPIQQWLHYAIVITRNPANDVAAGNAARYDIYINGVNVANTTEGRYPEFQDRLKVYLGRSGWTADQYFDGAMDTFNWYDYALPLETIKLHSKLIAPPFYELTFNVDPRVAALAGSISNVFMYGWVDRDSSAPVNSVHQGILDLNRASNQWVDLMASRGNRSLGLTFPTIGGPSSGMATNAGWSFEIVFKLRNVSLNYCKVFNTGNGANPSGILGDDNIVLGLRENRLFAFEILNSIAESQTIVPILQSTQADTWYSVVVVVRPVDQALYSGSYTAYVNGVRNYTGTGTYPQGIYRTNAFIGKSEWGSDPTCDMQLDAIRIYDYALSDAEVASLATLTVDGVVPTPSSTGSAGPTSSSTGAVFSIGCSIPTTRNIVDGSILAAVIIDKPLTSLSPNFGTVFINALASTIHMSSDLLGCSRAFNGNNQVANANPSATQSKVEFYLFNDQGSATIMFTSLSTSFAQFGTNLAANLDNTYVLVGNAPEQVNVVNSGSGSSGLSGGAIAGIVIGVIVGVFLLIGLAFFFLRGGRKSYDHASKHETASHQYDTHDDDHEHEHETNDEEVEMEDVHTA